MNKLFKNITTENYLELLHSFERSREIFWNEESNKLIHSGEYGEYREDLLKKFLNLYIPENYGISSGFIITPSGEISSQCDIIIYDKSKTPKIQNMENQRFFPIETILGVGEVKSTINTIGELNHYLRKLSKVKKLRKSIKNPKHYKRANYNHPFDPNEVFSDNIFTFLLCYKLNFKLDLTKIDYENINIKLWHNMVLSLKDGLISYQAKETKNLYFSFSGTTSFKSWFLKNDDSELPITIQMFLSSISYLVNNTTLLEIHMENYLIPEEKLTDDIN